MTLIHPAPPTGELTRPEVAAALLVLERMGLSPADLLSAPRDRPAVPTFADYIPVVAAAVTAGTRRAYGSYWNRVIDHWGGRRLDEPTPSEIRQLMAYVRTHVVARRNARGGRSAAEHLIAALRCLYRHAEADGLITQGRQPGPQGRQAPPTAVDPPRRARHPARRDQPDSRHHRQRPRTRHAAAPPAHRDRLPARRRSRTPPADLDPGQSLILLREKGETVRWQPVSPTLMTRLLQHAQDRHAPADGQLLRYASGKPITSRRYDHLWTRIGTHLPWVRTQQISTHWIRHTTLTWVERTFGYAIARAYAGHNDASGDTGVTSTYVRASLHEIAAALSALTGEPHPLAYQNSSD